MKCKLTFFKKTALALAVGCVVKLSKLSRGYQF